MATAQSECPDFFGKYLVTGRYRGTAEHTVSTHGVIVPGIMPLICSHCQRTVGHGLASSREKGSQDRASAEGRSPLNPSQDYYFTIHYSSRLGYTIKIIVLKLNCGGDYSSIRIPGTISPTETSSPIHFQDNCHELRCLSCSWGSGPCRSLGGAPVPDTQ